MVSFVEHNLPFEARPRNMQGESETRVPYRRHPGRPRTLVNTAWLMLFRRKGTCDNCLESDDSGASALLPSLAQERARRCKFVMMAKMWRINMNTYGRLVCVISGRAKGIVLRAAGLASLVMLIPS
jgi:hypothetical protein